MDDNKGNSGGNQPPAISDVPQPIFETVPVEGPSDAVTSEGMKPEEVAPDIAAPDQVAQGGANPEVLPSDQPLVYEESKAKYFAMAGGVIFFIIVLVGAFFLLKGGGKPAPKQDIKLTYWGLWEDAETVNPVIKAYEQKNPGITITYEKMDPAQYRDKLTTRSPNNAGPDIFRFHNTWLPEIRDIVSPLPAQVMTNAEYEKTFYPIAQKDLKIGQSYYGLPLYIDGLVLVYNESLFKRAGISTAPNNWDELIDDAGKVQVQDKDGHLMTAGIAIGAASNVDHFSDIFGLMLLLNGGQITQLDAKEAAGALEAFRRFAEKPNSVWSEEMPQSTDAFIQEKVAMIIVPSWELLTIHAKNPDLKMKVVPIPSPPGGKRLSLASYWAEGVNKYGKNQLEAWKFLKYLTEKDTLTKMYEAESANRIFGEPYSRVDMGSLLIQNEYTGAVIKQAQDDVYYSLPLSSATYDNGLNDGMITYIQNAINASIQGTSYSEALATAKKGADQLISRFKIE